MENMPLEILEKILLYTASAEIRDGISTTASMDRLGIVSEKWATVVAARSFRSNLITCNEHSYFVAKYPL